MILRAEAHGFLVSLVVIRAVQHDVAAVAARCRNLDQRRRQGHDDSCPDAEVRGVVGDGLRVVARRGCNHALGTFSPAVRLRSLFSAPRSL